MKTIEMELALLHYFRFNQNVVVPRVMSGWLVNHECDIISLTKSKYATEAEIKVSKSDLRKDSKKKHNHLDKKIKYFYFAVPEDLEDYAKEHIPRRAGLLIVRKIPINYYVKRKGDLTGDRYSVHKVIEAKATNGAVQWREKDRMNLLRIGAMRVVALMSKLIETTIWEKEK